MGTDFYTPPEVAKRLRVHRDTVMRWIRTGALQSKVEHQGKRVRHHIPTSEIEAIERRSQHQALV